MGIEDKLEKKIDKLVDDVHSIDTTLAAQHESLKIHIKRTEMLERRTEKIEKDINVVNGAFKVLMSIGVFGILFKFLLK